MHSPMVFKNSILQAAGSTMLVAALALISQQGAAAQSSQPSAVSNATTSSAPHVQNNPTPQPQLMTVPEDFAGLKLAPGFLINIIVYDEPDLSARVRVDKEGNIVRDEVKKGSRPSGRGNSNQNTELKPGQVYQADLSGDG